MVRDVGRGSAVNATERTNSIVTAIGNYTPVANHLKRKHIKLEPISYPSDVVYRPGQQITFEPPAHPLNFRNSYLRGTLHIGEINSDASIIDVTKKMRTIYKAAIVSRQGAVFDQYPLPVEGVDKAKYLSDIKRQGKARMTSTSFSTYKTNAITPYTAERKYITDNYDMSTSYVNGDNPPETPDIIAPLIKYGVSAVSEKTAPSTIQTGIERYKESGYTLNRRSMAYGITREIDDYDRYRMYERYSDGTTITPDEAISTWDAYGFYFDASITPNALYGYFCRSAFNLFSRIQIGTTSNINLFEDNQMAGITALFDMMEFEEDHFSTNRSCFWSSSRIPEVFGWRGYTNQRLIGIAEAPLGDDGTKIENWDGQQTGAWTRDHLVTGNPRPFYFPAQDIDFSIQLSHLSGCMNTDLHLNQNQVNNMLITLQLAGLDHVFDMGIVDGYHEGRALVDMVSMGSLTTFIRSILEIHDWSGWHVKGLRMDIELLEIDPSHLMQVYLPMFTQGRARPFVQHQHYEVAQLRGSELTKMATAMRTVEYKLQFGQGIIAGLAFYATIDGVNNAYVPIFDTLALQFGTSPTVVNFPDDIHQPYTISDLYRNMLYSFGKSDTHISNMPYDFVYGYGVPSHRRRLYEHEYFIQDKRSVSATAGHGFGLPGYTKFNTSLPYDNTFVRSDESRAAEKLYGEVNTDVPALNTGRQNLLSPLDHVRSIRSIYATKKMCGHEHSHFAIFDLRGDAPTAGSVVGGIMSGINTANMNNLYGNLHLSFRDTSLYERYQDRNFTIHMDVQLERLMLTQVGMDDSGNWRSNYTVQKDMQFESSMNNTM